MRGLVGAAALLGLIATPTVAEAQASGSCITEREATALFSYALPELLDAVVKKCAPTLPAQAFMPSHAPDLVGRYRAAGSTNWAAAKAVFLKSAGTDDASATKVLAAMPDDAVKTLLGTALGVAVTGDVSPADCPRVDKLVAAVAPLPASNMTAIIVQILALSGDKKDSFAICKA